MNTREEFEKEIGLCANYSGDPHKYFRDEYVEWLESIKAEMDRLLSDPATEVFER